MLISSNTAYANNKLTLKEIIDMYHKASFTAFDLSLFSKNARLELVFQDDYKEKTQELRKYADDTGIPCNQSHAIFPTAVGDPEKDREIFKEIVRDMEIASIMGAGITVVHPIQHLSYAEHPKELFEMNMEFYRKLIPYCEKFGIKIAVENMFQCNNKTKAVIDSTCSRPWEFCKYLDELNSEWIVGCLDVGHTNLVESDIYDFIHKLGNRRLKALHVHDNDGFSDNHTLPYTRSMDFSRVAQALAEIDYTGDFTFEADHFYANLPVEVYPAATKLMSSVGEFIVKEIERYKKAECGNSRKA